MGYKKGQLIPNNKLNIRMVDDMNLVCFDNDVSHVLYSSVDSMVDLIVGCMTCEVPPPVVQCKKKKIFKYKLMT